jgi:tetrahydromethanopterin S-methyltransferase subunit B
MRFKSYLQEQEYRKPFTVTSHAAEIVDWIQKNAAEGIHSILDDSKTNNRIYRGMRDSFDDFAIGDSRLFRRRAANTSNHIHSLIPTYPEWQSFPPRESAYICSTSLSGADLYAFRGYSSKDPDAEGSLYFVIPADTARIGVCPSYDFWACFDKVGLKGSGFFDVDDVNRFIDKLNTPSTPMPENNPTKLRHSLSKYNEQELKESMQDIRIVRPLVESMKKMHADNMDEWLEKALDPNANGFIHTKGEDYRGVDSRREVWINGKAAFIKVTGNSDRDIIEFLRKELEL